MQNIGVIRGGNIGFNNIIYKVTMIVRGHIKTDLCILLHSADILQYISKSNLTYEI